MIGFHELARAVWLIAVATTENPYTRAGWPYNLRSDAPEKE